MADESPAAAVSSDDDVTEPLSCLREVLRSRTPGYVSARNVDGGSEDATARADSVLGGSIDIFLSRAIPPEPANTTQRFYALKAICGIHGREASDDQIRAVIKDIYDRRPQFPASSRAYKERECPKIVSDLYDKLTKYVKLNKYVNIKDIDHKKFPYFEVLGHRSDDYESNLRGNGFTYVMSGPSRAVEEINCIVDQLVPPGAHFNDLRQDVLQLILDHGKLIVPWAQQNKQIKVSKEEWQILSDKKKLMGMIETKIGPWRAELERLPKQSPLAPFSVEIIGDMIRYEQLVVAEASEERSLKRRRGGAGDAIDARLPIGKDSVPECVKRAVCRRAPGRTDISDAVRMKAIRVADAMDAVAPPSRGTFNKRVLMMEKILRGEAIVSLAGPKGLKVAEKVAELEALEQAVESFHRAWSGRSRSTGSAERASGAPAPAAEGVDVSNTRRQSFEPLAERVHDRSRGVSHSRDGLDW